LEAATAALQSNDYSLACKNLTDIIGLVNAQSGKKLTTAQAQQLLVGAGEIRTTIGCS
jgi:hypothetical protein